MLERIGAVEADYNKIVAELAACKPWAEKEAGKPFAQSCMLCRGRLLRFKCGSPALQFCPDPTRAAIC